MKQPPYLSVVVTARNDDHGGNLLGRMQAFLNAWFGQVKRHGVSSELIVVDWNPPPDRPALMDALKWPADTGPCQVRFIQVPAEIHRMYKYADALPLYQMIAKNVAIRRARGRFVLATNIDIIFSDELMQFFAERKAEAGVMYRMDRHDVMADVPVDGTVDQQLEYCRTHLLRVCAREGYFEIGADGLRRLDEDDIAERGSGISFGRGWYAIERPTPGEKFRWVDNESEMFVTPPSDAPGAVVLELEAGPGVGGERFLLRISNADGIVMAESHVAGRSTLALTLPPGAGVRHTIRFTAPGGGSYVSGDPRIMNFRVFRCEWIPTCDPAPGVKQFYAEALPIGSPAAGQTESNGSASGSGFRNQPGPSTADRLVQFCRDCGGIVNALRGARLFHQRSRLFVQRAPWGSDVFSSDSGIHPGVGWQPLECFRGETFRWVSGEAELIVRAPEEQPAVLGLQIEPGPGVSSGAFELEVRDEGGAVVATAFVERLRYIELQLPVQRGRSQVFSLSARGGGLSCTNGDPRILNFRLFWCGWSRQTGSPGLSPLPDRQIRRAVPGLELGSGWREAGEEKPGEMVYAGESGAEIILEPHDQRIIGLTAAVQPEPGAGAFTLAIQNYRGETLASVPVRGSQEIQVELPLRISRSNVLRLYVEGADSLRPLFRVSRWNWAIKSDARARAIVAASLGGPVARGDGAPEQAAQAPGAVFLHTNTCGDFTLMAREHWFDLRGYPEFDMYSFHIDSVLCYAAHHGGAREVVLPEPMRCYHIEHGLGSGWTPEGEKKLFGRLQERGIPWMEYSDLVHWISDMRRFDCTMIFNRENWGLADYDLPQTVLSRKNS